MYRSMTPEGKAIVCTSIMCFLTSPRLVRADVM